MRSRAASSVVRDAPSCSKQFTGLKTEFHGLCTRGQSRGLTFRFRRIQARSIDGDDQRRPSRTVVRRRRNSSSGRWAGKEGQRVTRANRDRFRQPDRRMASRSIS